MKTSKFIFAVSFFGLVLTSCQTETETIKTMIDFEDVSLNSSGYLNGSDGTGSFFSGPGIFQTQFAQYADYSFWKGFACSSLTDSITPGLDNQYSVVSESGAMGSKKFAIAYDTAIVKIVYANHYSKIKSLMLTNSTYSYKALLNGTDYSHAFTDKGDNGKGDWFKVIIKGYFAQKEVGSVEYYLADFRNGKSFISKVWDKVDLSSFGQVDKLMFTFDSSDKSYGYLNNPSYVCIDNIELEYNK